MMVLASGMVDRRALPGGMRLKPRGDVVGDTGTPNEWAGPGAGGEVGNSSGLGRLLGAFKWHEEERVEEVVQSIPQHWHQSSCMTIILALSIPLKQVCLQLSSNEWVEGCPQSARRRLPGPHCRCWTT